MAVSHLLYDTGHEPDSLKGLLHDVQVVLLEFNLSVSSLCKMARLAQGLVENCSLYG